MIQTIYFAKFGDRGIDVSRRADGTFTLRTWSEDRAGVVHAAAPIYMNEEQAMALFDGLGRALILTLEDELDQIMEAM